MFTSATVYLTDDCVVYMLIDVTCKPPQQPRFSYLCSAGRYTYKQLGKELFKPSYLVTNKWDKKSKEMTKVNWPILFHHE